MNQEFCRVGYYVFNDYTEDEFKENPPTNLIYEKVKSKLT